MMPQSNVLLPKTTLNGSVQSVHLALSVSWPEHSVGPCRAGAVTRTGAGPVHHILLSHAMADGQDISLVVPVLSDGVR